MATFECETCGCVEHLSAQPECCSLCSSSWPTLIAGNVSNQVHDDLCPEEWFERDALEDGIGQPNGRYALLDMRTTPLGLAALFLSFIFMLAALPDGMQQCLEKHGFDACYTTLHR